MGERKTNKLSIQVMRSGIYLEMGGKYSGSVRESLHAGCYIRYLVEHNTSIQVDLYLVEHSIRVD